MSRMKLSNVHERTEQKGERVLLYGHEGIGKSTFAAQAPAPVFLGNEDGLTRIRAAKFPEPKSWADVLDAVRELTTEQHSFRTLVLDTVDWLEALNFAHVVRAKGKAGSTGIEDIGFGKGFNYAVDEWRRLLSALDQLRSQKRMHVIMLGHAHVKTFKNPEGDDFDRYTLKMNEKGAGVLKEWQDAVLFANYETFTKRTDNDRVKGVDGRTRVINTVRTAAWDAKNRYNLPETLPLSWDEFAAHIGVADAGAPDVRAEIETLLGQVTEEQLAAKVKETLAATDAADVNRLSAILNRLKARVAMQGAVA